MKEKVKRYISLILLFTFLVGMFTHLSIHVDTVAEPIEVEAASDWYIPEGTVQSTLCPYRDSSSSSQKNGVDYQAIGMSICWGCTVTGISEDVKGTLCTSRMGVDSGCDVTTYGSYLYFGNDMHENDLECYNHWYRYGISEIIGEHPENNHRGRGYNVFRNDEPTDGCAYHLEYYACYNCVAGVLPRAKYVNDENLLLYIDHYLTDTAVDTEYSYNGTPGREKVNDGEQVTVGGRKVTPIVGEGTVVVYWCPHCGEKLWNNEDYKYKDKACPDCDGYKMSAYYYWERPLIMDTLGSGVLHMEKQYRLTLSVAVGEGKVSLDNDTYMATTWEDHYYKDTIKAYAKPDEGYKFVGWYKNSSCTGNPVSTDGLDGDPYSFTIPEKDYTLYAKFEEIPAAKYSLQVSAGDGGSVEPDDINGSYEAGTELSVIAKPDTDYTFAGWTNKSNNTAGKGIGNGNPDNLSPAPTGFEFKMPEGDVVLQAVFHSPTPTQTRRWACRDCAPARCLSLARHKKQERLPQAVARKTVSSNP